MKTKPVKWLDRMQLVPCPYWCVVFDKEQYEEAMKYLGVKHYKPPRDTPGGRLQTLLDDEGKECAIIEVYALPRHSLEQVHGLMVHEGAHFWQHICEGIGETNASSEFEAYGMQFIAQKMFYAYADYKQRSPRKARSKKAT
jgi:hypothetical protein